MSSIAPKFGINVEGQSVGRGKNRTSLIVLSMDLEALKALSDNSSRDYSAYFAEIAENLEPPVAGEVLPDQEALPGL